MLFPVRGHPCSWLTVGVRQPPFGTFTLGMTPMLGVPRNSPLSIRTAGFHVLIDALLCLLFLCLFRRICLTRLIEARLQGCHNVENVRPLFRHIDEVHALACKKQSCSIFLLRFIYFDLNVAITRIQNLVPQQIIQTRFQSSSQEIVFDQMNHHNFAKIDTLRFLYSFRNQ